MKLIIDVAYQKYRKYRLPNLIKQVDTAKKTHGSLNN